MEIDKSYIQFLGTLANEKRLKILLTLREKNMSVSDLIKKTNLNQTTISHNLKRLQICGFVSFDQKGKFRIYSVNNDTIKPLIEIMEKHTNKYCCKVVRDKNISNRYKSKNIK